MGESFKAVCSLILCVAILAGAIAWSDDRPSQATWIVRIASPLLGILSLAVLLKVHFRRDRAPDYLQATAGNYFNRGGFCFAFSADVVDGVCQFHAWFQNQYERPCIGRIAVRPARGFFLTRAKIDTLVFKIAVDSGAFGVATLPIPLQRNVQGKLQAFEVGASVEYPQGKGRRLRYRDGVFLRRNSYFDDPVGRAITLAGFLTGHVMLSSPATATVQLPTGASEDLPGGSEPRTTTIWKLGDPPLDDQSALPPDTGERGNSRLL